MKAGGSFGLSGWLGGSRKYNTRCTLAVCSRCAYSEASGHANRCDSALAAITGMILVFPAIFDWRLLGAMGKTPASHPESLVTFGVLELRAARSCTRTSHGFYQGRDPPAAALSELSSLASAAVARVLALWHS